MLNSCLYFSFSATIEEKNKEVEDEGYKGKKERVKTKKQIVTGKRKYYRTQTSKNWWMHSRLHPAQTSPLAPVLNSFPGWFSLWTLPLSDPISHTRTSVSSTARTPFGSPTAFPCRINHRGTSFILMTSALLLKLVKNLQQIPA